MRTTFYPKLAANNIKKNRKTYFPFILTCIVTIAMFYIFKSLSMNPGIEQMLGGDTIIYILGLGSVVVAIFAFIFLFYINSFLVKRRKKEFGVFNILGMEKRHLALVLGWETLYVMAVSLAAGIGLGIALDKLMFLLIGKIAGAQTVLGFFVSSKVVAYTVKLAAAIFVLIFLNAVCQIQISNPMELLQDSRAGEKEPKTKRLMTVLGIVCIGSGYYIAAATKNPITSIPAFFVAVLLVIFGTYFLFTAGSIAFLKLMRKNKKYYYQSRHFISISGMIYRMKQNAVGLANICILSTMVLVMVSSTSSMIIGMDDILKTRYTSEFMVLSHEKEQARNEEVFDTVYDLQKEHHFDVKNEVRYRYLNFSALRDGDTFIVDRSAPVTAIDSSYVLFFMMLEDYNYVEGQQKTLGDKEILVYSVREEYEEPVVKLFGKEYQIREKLDHFTVSGTLMANMSNTLIMIVPDEQELHEIYEQQQEAYGDIATNISEFYGFDSAAGQEEQKQFYAAIQHEMKARDLNTWTESRAAARMDFASLYGGFFFIGTFLAALFVMATVLIIYYKQISEGYDDRERFAIMQKVGMERREVRAAIRSQVLTVFFLPLLAAFIHVAAAFPLISRLLALMNFVNTKLYIMCTGVSFLVFALMYIVIYVLTARVYYRIVSK